MRYLSLFSGIEAASAAWAQLGWECAGVAEIEPFPCQLLKKKYPKVPNLGDITKITEDDIAALGRIDLVVFGSPCQDLSVAGKRKGLDGARSGLFFEAMRIVAIARARSGCRWALWENVFGAFSCNKGLDFAAVVDAMVGLEIGTTTPTAGKKWGNEGCAVGPDAMVEWGTLDAQWFGVAQRRRRVFALADFGDWANRPPILLEPQSMRGNSAPRREAGESVARATAVGVALRGREGGGTAELGDECGGALRASGGGGDKPYVLVSEQRSVLAPHADSVPPIAMCLNAGGMGRIDYESETMIVCATGQVTHTLKADGFDASEDGTGRGTPLVPVAYRTAGDGAVFEEGDRTAPLTTGTDPCANIVAGAMCRNVYSGGMGGRVDMAVQGYVQPTAMAVSLRGRDGGATAELGDDVGNCLRASGGGGDKAHVLASMAVRRLTPTECERLQGFPEVKKNVKIRACLDHQNPSASAETQCLKSPNNARSAEPGASPPSASVAGQSSSTRPPSQSGRVAVNVQIDLERMHLHLHSAGRLLLSVSLAEPQSRYPLLTQLGNIAPLLVQVLATLERTTTAGRAASHPHTNPSLHQLNGGPFVELSGQEIGEFANDAETFTKKASAFTKFITSQAGQSFLSCSETLRTLCCFATAAISLCIQEKTNWASSYEISIDLVQGYTAIPHRNKPAADGPRYKALGNSMCVNVMAWIGRQIDFAHEFF